MGIKDLTFHEETIGGVLDRVAYLIDTYGSKLWFRGQGNYHNLVPSALRHAQFIATQRGAPVYNTAMILNGAKMLAPNFFSLKNDLENKLSEKLKIKPTSNIEWMFLMQHYAIPTMLLDWTTDPMIALFFATNHDDSKMQQFKHVEFWCISPEKANSKGMFKEPKTIYSAHDDHVEYHINNGLYTPMFIESEKLDDRIIFQKGVFSLHGTNYQPLNFMFENDTDVMFKIKINCIQARRIRDTLNKLGYTNDYFYPTKDINFDKEITKIINDFSIHVRKTLHQNNQYYK